MVLETRIPSTLRTSLSKLGVPEEVLEMFFNWMNGGNSPKIPEAKGAISAIQSEAFFIPLYELYLNYGGIFRLTFGPKVCLFLFGCTISPISVLFLFNIEK